MKQQNEENEKFNLSPTKNKSTAEKLLTPPIEENKQRDINEFFNSTAAVVHSDDDEIIAAKDSFDIQDKVVDELNEQV